jgi:hypothetical protein
MSLVGSSHGLPRGFRLRSREAVGGFRSVQCDFSLLSATKEPLLIIKEPDLQARDERASGPAITQSTGQSTGSLQSRSCCAHV